MMMVTVVCDRLRAVGVKTELERTSANELDERFAGKQFVLTGKMEGFTRDEARALIEALAAVLIRP